MITFGGEERPYNYDSGRLFVDECQETKEEVLRMDDGSSTRLTENCFNWFRKFVLLRTTGIPHEPPTVVQKNSRYIIISLILDKLSYLSG